MKVLLLPICLAAALVTGCAAPLFTERAVPVPTVSEVPVEHVTKTTRTDEASGAVSVVYVTNTVSQLVTNWSTNTVFEVSETIARPIAAAASLNAAVQTVAPNPASGTLNLVLGGIAGLLGWMARVKTKAAQRAAEDAEDHRQGAVRSNELLETMIVGVEEANVPAVKETIAKISKQWGNAAELHNAVKQLT